MGGETVSGNIQFARSTLLYPGSMNKEDLGSDPEVGAEPLPAKIKPYIYPRQTVETS